MDSSKKCDHPLPEEKAIFLSKVFFSWLLPFFKYGYAHDLETHDLYNCAQSDLSGPLGDELERNWNCEVQNSSGRSRLLRALSTTFGKQYVGMGVVTCVQCVVLRMYLPIILSQYISYYDEHHLRRSSVTGWCLATGVIFVSFLSVLLIHYGNLVSQRIGMRSRVATCSLIYRKLLRLKKSSLGQVTVGKLVNLLSNDVQRFDAVSLYLHYIWIMPIQTVVAFGVMFSSVRWAALAGFVFIILQAALLEGYLSKLLGTYRMKIAQKSDNRVRLMSEITSGIRAIKMYAWEKSFEQLVALARKYEVKLIGKASCVRGVQTALMVVIGRTASYLTFVAYVLLGHGLTAHVVFAVMQLFNSVQMYICIFFPLGLSLLAEAKTSVKRIEEFLLLEENSCFDQKVASLASGKSSIISIHNVSAKWLPNQIVRTFQDISLEIEPGTLCCIVGTVGSGKSSFLQLLLKELPCSSGRVAVSGTVSYSSQEPWLFASSVRNNILFGEPYVEKKYNDVVRVCALRTDLSRLPHSDKTLVGERGVSLSGGQRARINLARAVYRDADIYLLDDPLSAVDAHVSRHLFRKCITEYLKDKTRIVVTHQLRFLREADLIVVLNNGQIEKIGSFHELSESELKDLDLNEEQPALNKEEIMEETQDEDSTSSKEIIVSDDDDNSEPEETQELMEKGSIPTSTYWEYYRAGATIPVLLILVLLFVISQCSCNGSDLWLTYWTNMEQDSSAITEDEITLTNVTKSGNLQLSYIKIYSILMGSTIFLMILRSLIFLYICMEASKRLHNIMFSNLLQATIRFFDTNPCGRILNRFTQDTGTMDELLPRATLESVQIFLVMSGILIVVLIVSPWMTVVVIILGVFFYGVRIVYLKTAQDVKRLEGITRAPLFSHVSASFCGLATIRSANAQNMIIHEFDSIQNVHTSSWFLSLATSGAFGLYLDIISVIFLTIVTYQFLIFDDGTTKSGYVGLVISQTLVLTGMLQHGVRRSAEVASAMTSVERILQYTKLEKEGPFETLPTNKPSRDWPQNGRVVFKNVYLHYDLKDPPILKNVNLEILAGEKVGVVGRTGAGKSSLIAALFRLSYLEGAVEIDDVNTNLIGLKDLRSNISIIPQDPVLFSNSVRHNLDPFERCTDEVLWRALKDVELKDAIGDLEQRIEEGGSNFSVGQRQLLCLARAIVKDNKILVLDEATANVDPTTDALIQATIRKNFKSSTVLTIAHRLNTVMDSDKVLVMDAGEVVEFGHPHKLLQNEDGCFGRMVKRTGLASEKQLRQIAKDSYLRKTQKNT